MNPLPISIGQSAVFTKTVGETDVYLFAGITGDFAPNHVNESYMKKSSYGTRQAHGALMVGFMSTASSLVTASARTEEETPVSLGYDRVRFILPVYLGDTISAHYEIVAVDEERRRAEGAIEIFNQDGKLVSVGTHVLKWVKNAG